MQKWEYYEDFNLSIDTLNTLGENGWELVAVFGTQAFTHFYFKRLLSD
jgi:hypothetical protein